MKGTYEPPPVVLVTPVVVAPVVAVLFDAGQTRELE